MISTSCCLSLQPLDRGYLLITSGLKSRGRGQAREFSSTESRGVKKKTKNPQKEEDPFSIQACHSPKRKTREREALRFKVNSFLEGSEAEARSFIFTELDHKWDPARCSVICHQIARMWCPNTERMSCPKRLFLAASFPALRSKLGLIDKHGSQTPSAPHPSPPRKTAPCQPSLAHPTPHILAWLGLL